MTKKKTLLEEGTVRQFMKLANLRPLANPFVDRLYESDQEELTEEEEELVEVDLGEDDAADDDWGGNKGDESETDPGHIDYEGDEDEVEVDAEEEVGGEEEAEVSITPEEAEVLIGLGNKLAAEVPEEGGEEELPPPEAELPEPEGEDEIEVGAEEEEEEVLEEDFDKMISTIAENVTKRIKTLSAAKKTHTKKNKK